MKRIITILIVMIITLSLLTSCTSNEAKEAEKETEQNTAEQDSQEETPKDNKKGSDAIENVEALTAKLEEMSDFLNEGLDLVNDYDLSMELLEYKMMHSQPNLILVNFDSEQHTWEREYESEEYGMYTLTSMDVQNDVYYFNNIAYDLEDKTTPTVETRMFYDNNTKIYENHVVLSQPATVGRDQYYVDENGALYIVNTQLTKETIYIDTAYYDGSYIKIARVYKDGKTELTVPYDISQAYPATADDIFTEDRYDTIFTYDGTNYEWEDNY